MFRLLLTIFFFFAGVGLVAEQLVDSKYSLVQSSDEDNDVAKDSEKTQEENIKEKFFSNQYHYAPSAVYIAGTFSNYRHRFLPSGFINKPFTPPDLF